MYLLKNHNIKKNFRGNLAVSYKYFSVLNFFFIDYQEKYQELLEREDFFPDYEENGTDLSGGGDP